MRFKIQTLNNISIKGLERLPRERFEVASEIGNPDAILVRSADMHKVALPESLRAARQTQTLGVHVTVCPYY